jgi:hypothetical protein
MVCLAWAADHAEIVRDHAEKAWSAVDFDADRSPRRVGCGPRRNTRGGAAYPKTGRRYVVSSVFNSFSTCMRASPCDSERSGIRPTAVCTQILA